MSVIVVGLNPSLKALHCYPILRISSQVLYSCKSPLHLPGHFLVPSTQLITFKAASSAGFKVVSHRNARNGLNALFAPFLLACFCFANALTQSTSLFLATQPCQYLFAQKAYAAFSHLDVRILRISSNQGRDFCPGLFSPQSASQETESLQRKFWVFLQVLPLSTQSAHFST